MADKKEDDKPIKTLTAEDIRLLKTVSGDLADHPLACSLPEAACSAHCYRSWGRAGRWPNAGRAALATAVVPLTAPLLRCPGTAVWSGPVLQQDQEA